MMRAVEEPVMRLIVPCAAVVIGLCLGGCGSDRSTDAASSPASTTNPVSDQAPGGPAPAVAPAAAAAAGTDLPKSVNTLDPVDGLPVDPALPPVVVEVDIVSPPLSVVVGISSAENAKRIQADPMKYAGAALHNRVARLETDTLLPK
jgi:outer membrane murein-binding lipoprotein Lpp